MNLVFTTSAYICMGNNNNYYLPIINYYYQRLDSIILYKYRNYYPMNEVIYYVAF